MKDATPETSVHLRDATPDDARALAELIGIAGAGIPQWLWSAMAEPGEEVFDVGTRRARRTSGGFSWRNAIVAENDGAVIGMILGYASRRRCHDHWRVVVFRSYQAASGNAGRQRA